MKLEEDGARCRRENQRGRGKRVARGLEGHLREAWDQNGQKEGPAWHGEGRGHHAEGVVGASTAELRGRPCG